MKEFEKWFKSKNYADNMSTESLDKDNMLEGWEAALNWVDTMFKENMRHPSPINNVKKEIEEELGEEAEDK